MSVLPQRDLERLVRFIGEAEGGDGEQPFTGALLVELGHLIEADWVTYTEVDHLHRRSLVYLSRPGDEDDDGAQICDDDWELMHDHPVCRRWRKDGRFSALRMSDVVARREFRASRFYAEFCKPWGIEYELKVRLPSPPWHAKTFMFNRKPGRDFTKRDRLVLELLAPHLARLWQVARTRRVLDAALEALDGAPESDQRAVVLLGAAGDVEFASTAARRLLGAFFLPVSRGRLPVEVVDWLDSGAREPLRKRSGDDSVVVERSGDTLVLHEQRRDVELTPRENEVMGWVARGKTNGQIAELLWLSPGTVRKHLENVYAKLGVSTRTEAAARFLGALDAGRS